MKNKWESKNFILSDVSYIGTCKNKHLSTLHPNVFHLDAEFSKKKNFPERIHSLYFQLIAESNNEMQQSNFNIPC